MKIKKTKISSGCLTTVPAAIRTALKVKPGDSVEWFIETLLEGEHQPGGAVIVEAQAVIVRKAEAKI